MTFSLLFLIFSLPLK